MIAVVGPCISKKNYEVKVDFFKKFTGKNKLNKKFFNTKNNKMYFSLNDYIKENLLKLGVKNIEIVKYYSKS